jgi:hypothetical protein
MKSVCLLLLVAALPLNASDQGLFGAASMDFAISGPGLSGAPAVSVWQTFGAIGLGIQVRTIVGFQIWDVSVVPMAILRLGALELGLGVSLLVRPPDVPYYAFENGVAPAALVGLSLPLADLGPGKIAASLGAGLFPTADSQSGSGPFAGLSFIGSWPRLYAGIGYQFRL